MFARVSIIEWSPTRIDEAIRFMREKLVPAGGKMQGIKGLYLLVDRKTGKQMGITFWETEADLNATADLADRLREQVIQTDGARQGKVEIYEVAVQP